MKLKNNSEGLCSSALFLSNVTISPFEVHIDVFVPQVPYIIILFPCRMRILSSSTFLHYKFNKENTKAANMPRKSKFPTSPTDPTGSDAWRATLSTVHGISNPPPADTSFTIVNVVSTTYMSCQLDLHHIAQSTRNSEYNQKRFTAVIMRIRDPKATALIFQNGRTNVVGAKSVQESRLAARKFTRIIQRLGYAAKFEEFAVRNVVAGARCFDSRLWMIRMEGFVFKYKPWSCYEPEIFPGCVFRMEVPRLVSSCTSTTVNNLGLTKKQNSACSSSQTGKSSSQARSQLRMPKRLFDRYILFLWVR
jgi:transcription initiation factor TFIID TATA-box-binding protein